METDIFLTSSVRRAVFVCILVSVLVTASNIVSPVSSEIPDPPLVTYENIDVDTAYCMVTNDSLSDLVILDVRSELEYDMGHLYDTVLLPQDELETRIEELEDHKNNEIVVYCRSGNRSQVACETLVEHNFTKVYNMLGGILAWIDADYPIYTTFHYITVNIVGEEILLQIEPLLVQTGCMSCIENQTCDSCIEPSNITSTVLEQEENCTEILVTYIVNGTAFETTIVETLLWSYSNSTYPTNRTASFTSVEITSENISTQFYSINYLVRHVEYNLTLHTTLTPFNLETYNSAFTVMDYVPAEKNETLSMEYVQFNQPATPSQQYKVLGKVAKEVGKVYEKSGHTELIQLAQNYYTMKEEAKYLSKLVKQQIPEYDNEILNSSAVLTEPPEFENGGGGGGGEELPPCDFWCFLDCILYDPQAAAECTYCCWVCAIALGPYNPACWLCLACISLYAAGCYTVCCM